MQARRAGQNRERLRKMLTIAAFRLKQEEINYFAIRRDGRTLQIIGINSVVPLSLRCTFVLPSLFVRSKSERIALKQQGHNGSSTNSYKCAPLVLELTIITNLRNLFP